MELTEIKFSRILSKHWNNDEWTIHFSVYFKAYFLQEKYP